MDGLADAARAQVLIRADYGFSRMLDFKLSSEKLRLGVTNQAPQQPLQR
jgi:hypothetical protein